MKKSAVIFCVLVVLTLTFAMTTDGQAAGAPKEKQGKVIAETMVAENATVKAIDLNTRTVTLLLSDGREQTFVVDKAVRRLNEVKVGDTVKARYHEAVSVKLNKTKVAPGVDIKATVEREEKSPKPAGTKRLWVSTTATIERISDDGRKVTLRMPDDSTADVRVRDPENLAKIKKGEVKVGDQIEITYYRALALSVEKAAKK